jgi:plasmid maintenance system antidote protein VapI
MATDDPRVMGRDEAAHVREVLRERGLKQGDLAIKTGIWPSDLCSILNGRRFISPDMRARLDSEVKRLREERE